MILDTDITSDDEELIYTRIPKHGSSFTTDKTLQEETYSTIKNQSPPLHKNPYLQSTYKQIPNMLHIVHKSYLFMILPSLSTKIIFKVLFFLMTTR